MLLLGFLITATFWPYVDGAGTVSRWAVLCVAVPIGLFWVRVIPFPALLVVGLLGFWATLSLIWTTVFDDGIYQLAQFAVIAGCLVIGTSVRSLRAFYTGAAYGLAISSFIAILQFLGYEPVQTTLWGTDIGPHQVPPSGLFINPDLLGEICIVVLVGLWTYRQYWMTILVLPGLILSQSRTAMVAAVICVLAYAWPRARWKSLLAIPLLIAIVYAIAPYKWHIETLGGGRLDLWLDTLQGLTFWGHGVGSFYSTFIKYATHVDTFHYQPDNAHNDLLQFTFELGVPAAVALVATLSVVWWQAFEPERLVLLAFAVIGMLAFPLHEPATAAVFGIVAGYAARNWRDLRYPLGYRKLPLYSGG